MSNSSSNITPLLDSVSATEPMAITNGLSLGPRIRLRLTVHRADNTVAALDEWKLKRSLVDFLKSTTNFSYPISVREEDLVIRRFKDLKKRKRGDPVARGSLVIRDLGFVKESAKREVKNGDKEEVKVLERMFKEWRKLLVEKMDEMEVSLEGVKFRLRVEVPIGDDFDRLRKEWEVFYAFDDTRGYSRGAEHGPDTIILRGVPSRWFAEPRVSSKPSMLVTHTIFSSLGKIRFHASPLPQGLTKRSKWLLSLHQYIPEALVSTMKGSLKFGSSRTAHLHRNLNVSEDDDLGEDTDEDSEDIIPGLHCKIVVQFEKHRDFHSALKVLCSRSLEKEGSRMKADFEVSWDRDGYFRNTGKRTPERDSRMPAGRSGRHRYEDSRQQRYTFSYSPDYSRPKRFKE